MKTTNISDCWCPFCDSRLIVTKYYDDEGYFAETDSKCTSCKYHYSWSYGREEIETPEDEDE